MEVSVIRSFSWTNEKRQQSSPRSSDQLGLGHILHLPSLATARIRKTSDRIKIRSPVHAPFRAPQPTSNPQKQRQAERQVGSASPALPVENLLEYCTSQAQYFHEQAETDQLIQHWYPITTITTTNAVASTNPQHSKRPRIPWSQPSSTPLDYVDASSIKQNETHENATDGPYLHRREKRLLISELAYVIQPDTNIESSRVEPFIPTPIDP